MAELLTEQGDLEARWTGLRPGSTPACAGEDRDELQLLLRLRYRLRVDLGLPEDDYDKMLDDRRPGRRGSLNPGRRTRPSAVS